MAGPSIRRDYSQMTPKPLWGQNQESECGNPTSAVPSGHSQLWQYRRTLSARDAVSLVAVILIKKLLLSLIPSVSRWLNLVPRVKFSRGSVLHQSEKLIFMGCDANAHNADASSAAYSNSRRLRAVGATLGTGVHVLHPDELEPPQVPRVCNPY